MASPASECDSDPPEHGLGATGLCSLPPEVIRLTDQILEHQGEWKMWGKVTALEQVSMTVYSIVTRFKRRKLPPRGIDGKPALTTCNMQTNMVDEIPKPGGKYWEEGPIAFEM